MNIFILQKCDNGCCYCNEIIGIFSSLSEVQSRAEEYLQNHKCTVTIEEWKTGQEQPVKSYYNHNLQGNIEWSANE